MFHAVLEQASGIIPSMKSIDPNYPVEKIIFTGGYLARGIREVGNGVFGQVVRTAEELDKIKKLAKVGSDAIKNGLASPKTLIQGLSTELGAVAAENLEGLKTIAKKFVAGVGAEKDLQKALKGAIPDMKLLGSFNLADLIDEIGAGKLPVINQLKLPEVLQHTWKWTLPIQDSLEVLIVTYRSEPRKTPRKVCLHIEIVTTTRLPKPEEIAAGKRPEGSVALDAYLGHWDNAAERPDPPPKVADPATGSSFSITLLELVEVYFRQVRVEARYALGGSAKPKVTPEIVTVDFVGPLKFVKDLQEKLGNLGGGFKLAITPNFLEMSYEFLIPPISFGAFSMRNIRIGAGLMLPFGDDPLRFRFNFSSFAVPFELTVMAFGGRGFLRVELDTGGGRLLEGALEFGGSLAFDVGVASGGLYVMAGAYFKITQSSTSLSGYLRAGGTLSVLGLIHASVEFLLMVTYREFEGGNELYGTATLTVSIEFLFFSIDVNITMEKRIAGSDSKKSGIALLESDRLVSIGARQPMPAVRPRGENRPAYFARPGIPGRFAWDENHPARSAARWNSEYWSQFDYR